MEAVANVYTFKGGLAKRAKDFMESSGMTITEFAREINYSRPALSQYLSGKYGSDPSEIESKIVGFLSERTGETIHAPVTTSPAPAKPTFYESRDAVNIIGVCSSCQEFTGLGIVVGKSGYGKTHTLKYYAKLPKVAYIECDDTMGQRDLVKAIEKSLGIPAGYGTIWERVNGIREFFNVNRGYLLIIDEADKLISKYTQKKMEILRAIFDQSDVGLVIAGEPKLESQIKGYLSRFANRVDFFTTLKGLSTQEVQAYLENFNFENEALHEMVIRATNNKTGCFRLLDRTLNNVLRVNTTSLITVETISKASNMMML